MTEVCLHCGEVSPNSSFCCLGCRTAYDLIQSAGLIHIYDQKERRWKPPAPIASSDFEIFDDPAFLASRTHLKEGLREGDFVIQGLMCSACIFVLERLSRFETHIVESRIDYGRSLIHLKWRDGAHGLSRIAEKIARLGYDLKTDHIDFKQSRIPKREWIRWGLSGASAAGAMHIGLLLLGSHGTDLDSSSARMLGFFAGLTALPAITYGAAPFFKKSWQGLQMRHLSSDILVAASVLVGSAVSLWNALRGDPNSYFDALAMIIFLLLGGRILVRLASLQAFQRPAWRARRGGRWVSAEVLRRDDEIEVEVAEVIPIDCRLVSAMGWFDFSAISGESLPVKVVAGQSVPQGAVAQSHLNLKVDRPLADSHLEVLNRRLRETVSYSQDFRRESIFTLSVLGLAVFVGLSGFEDSIAKAIAILVVSCPCALQLSKPLSMLAFKRASLREGISVLRPERCFEFRDGKSIGFDKTGTLTLGRMDCVDELLIDGRGFEIETLYALVYQLSVKSDHPLSRSLSVSMAERKQESLSLNFIEEIAGVGLKARWGEAIVELRKPRDESGLSTSLYIDGHEAIRFSFQDRVRPEAADVLKKLKSLGYRLRLISGDRTSEVESFSARLGDLFGEAKGNLSPAEKANLQTPRDIFVGDGLNDAEAMRRAGFGIGFAGSAEANLKAADIYLLKRDLNLIPQILRGLKKLQTTYALNLGLSIGYNILCFGLILGGYLGPVICAICMPLSSLSVMALATTRKSY